MKKKRLLPELILLNGNFRTMDSDLPRAQAVAINGGRIMAVGNNDAIGALADASTKQIDLEGDLALPGMIDSHFHYYEWVRMRKYLNLADVTSFSECMRNIHIAAEKEKPDGWIIGQGFNESDWPENQMPSRSDLDEAAPHHPVIIWRCDLHLAVANSQALAQAGVHRNTPDPPEGLIERDAGGDPTGILREQAINLVKETIPPLTEEEIMDAMKDGMPELHSIGLTGLHDIRIMGGAEGAAALRSWQKLNEASELRLRTWVTIPGERIDEAIALGLRTGFGDERLRLGHLKYFADGGMGARTAWMIDPYIDAGSGMPLTTIEELEQAVVKADAAGLAVMIHAVGDRTNRELARMFEKLLQHNKIASETHNHRDNKIPHRIEHLQMIRKADINKLAGMGIAGCVQPHNMILDINMIDQSVGKQGKHAYAFRNMLNAGIPLMFSSDCPVADPSPLVGIHAAVTRQRTDRTPKGGWYPDQSVTVDEAVRAYTLNPAVASGVRNQLGSISPGKHADIVVLDKDIYTIEPDRILNTRVVLTIFDGKIAFQYNSS
jgi:predicted amidohydrolase YtcJ